MGLHASPPVVRTEHVLSGGLGSWPRRLPPNAGSMGRNGGSPDGGTREGFLAQRVFLGAAFFLVTDFFAVFLFPVVALFLVEAAAAFLLAAFLLAALLLPTTVSDPGGVQTSTPRRWTTERARGDPEPE